jgi:hypothetical protein
MHLKVLRQELRKFLACEGLPTNLVEREPTWLRFIYFYTSDEVQELTITLGPQLVSGYKYRRWSFRLKNGKELSAATLYGAQCDQCNNLIKSPDFLDEFCQL